MAGFIDIEYETLKQAIQEIEKKKGVCEKLPSARFRWAYERLTGGVLQVGNNMPNLMAKDDCSDVMFELIVCDQLGGKSTGTSAAICYNCKPELLKEQDNG
jgi:hypothetical protein